MANEVVGGQLYLCATPIGNLGDITLRVLETLKQVDLIYAEDTRHTRKLLNHFEITTSLRSLHEHNERFRLYEVIENLGSNLSVALVSDAGLPLISDPGGDLVRAVQEAGFTVTCLPGASAPATALLLSGIATMPYTFVGFLPPKMTARQRALQTYWQRPETLVLFEAPHRLLATLRDLLEIFGDREAAVCRELTKRFEDVRRASISDLIAHYAAEAPRGEICLVISGAQPVEIEVEADPVQLQQRAEALQAEGLNKKQVLKTLEKESGLKRNVIYQALLENDAEL